ncbi:S8 family serine peptidase [Pontimicrobium sp. MEBiC01747]
MKTLKLTIMCFVLLLLACCSDELTEESNESTLKNNMLNKKSKLGKNVREFIVHYNIGTTNLQKEALRNMYEVQSYKQCSCQDDTLELWRFAQDLTESQLEEKKSTASDDPDLDGASLNNGVQLPNNYFGSAILDGDIDQALNLQVESNENITVAILDTGVNYIAGGFTEPFLYNNSANKQCEATNSKDLYGWDFVNEDNDPFDDHNHGTQIASIINSNLINKGISHQILPVKVFDADGKTNTFRILCGLKYALSKPEVAIINMSFGSYSYQELFDRILANYSNRVLIVASAGNQTNDNDEIPHYPSSYEHDNIISIAGMETITDYTAESYNNSNLLAWYSNYGVNNVDIAAPGNDYSFTINGQSTTVQGTSFASAFVAYKSAALYSIGDSPLVLKNKVIDNSTEFVSGLETIKHRAAVLE